MSRVLAYLRDLPPLALATVAVGLLATGGAHWLTNTDLTVSVDEYLRWETSAGVRDSEPAKLGRKGKIRITEGSIAATRPNTSDFRVYRVAAALDVTTGAPERRANVSCTVGVPKDVIYAKTPARRAAFPQPSDDLVEQGVSGAVAIRFNAKGTDTVGLELEDVIDEFVADGDVVVEWAPFRERRHTFEWVLRGGERTEPVHLEFATMWRTAGPDPSARISCTVETVQGASATISTEGTLKLTDTAGTTGTTGTTG